MTLTEQQSTIFDVCSAMNKASVQPYNLQASEGCYTQISDPKS